LAASDGVRRPVAGAPQQPDAPPPRRSRLWPLVLGGALLLGAAAVGVIGLVNGGGEAAPRSATTARTTSTPPATTSTAPAPTASARGTNAYADGLARLIAAVGQRNGLTLAVRVDLIPRHGGDVTGPAAILRYRRRVTGAAIAIGLVDDATVAAWKRAGPTGQASSLRAWARLVRRLLPGAAVEIAVVGGAGTVATASVARGDDAVVVRLPG
jgi:hypothetical protein